MPIYDFHCHTCDEDSEHYVRTSSVEAVCLTCGDSMKKRTVYFPVMVKYGHGYPSRRKLRGGTAPYCGGQKAPENSADWNRYMKSQVDDTNVHGGPEEISNGAKHVTVEQ